MHGRRFRRVPVMDVVRRELKIPFEFSRSGVESPNAARVQVVSQARIAVVISSGIAGGPEQRVGFGGVGARHPDGPDTDLRR